MSDLKKVYTDDLISELSRRSDWICESYDPSSYQAEYTKVFWIAPDSVGWFYKMIASTGSIRVAKHKVDDMELYQVRMIFNSIDDSSVRLDGPYENHDKAVRRASRLKDILSEYLYVPNKEQLSLIAANSGTTLSVW